MKRIKLKNKKETLLIVDFLSMFYRGLYTNNGLEHEGTPTGGLYGMLKLLVSTIHTTKPDRVIFCSDSKPYFRSEEYPEYKMDRNKKEKDEEELEQLLQEQKMCSALLKILQIPYIYKKGFEADDLIALLVKQNYKNKNIVVASTDTDLYQLLAFENVSIFKGAEKGLYTRKDFDKEFSDLESPKQWNNVLAYTGGHNGFEGIHSVGIKTAIKIVSKGNISPKIKAKISSRVERKKVLLNTKLGKLPFYKCASHVVKIPKTEKYNERDLIRFLGMYGIQFTNNHSENINSIHK